MTAPTDALRAECEKALREWWISPDASNAFGRPTPGLGPAGMVDAAFRAGFNVLAARVEAWCQRLETEREEDFVIRQMKRDIAAELRAALKETKP